MSSAWTDIPGSCEALVVGAGPCGSIAARHLAHAGRRVVLIDRATFPRQKVCGCCLNQAALGVLESEGLGDLCSHLGGAPLHSMRLVYRGRSAEFATRPGIALSRAVLDHGLLGAAREAGLCAAEGVSARIAGPDPHGWIVELRAPELTTRVIARTVLCADGLAGGCLPDEPRWKPDIDPRSRIGLGGILSDPKLALPSGRVDMAIGSRGYVGMVLLEDGAVDVAAAIDAEFVRDSSPARSIASVLRDAGCQAPAGLDDLKFRGTPLLTRRRACLEHQGLFVAGDAASYVEPFTGEGMSWALASGVLAAEAMNLVLDGRYQAGAYTRGLQARTSVRARACRGISGILRRPTPLGVLFRGAELMPRWTSVLAGAVAGRIGRPFPRLATTAP